MFSILDLRLIEGIHIQQMPGDDCFQHEMHHQPTHGTGVNRLHFNDPNRTAFRRKRIRRALFTGVQQIAEAAPDQLVE